MNDTPPTTVVWVEPSDAADARRALDEWGRARGVTLREPLTSTEPSTLAIDPAVADRIEAELAIAREALVGEDADATERALARADADVLAHPELPQAAWLRAEVERGWSARWSHLEPKDPLRAEQAWKRADALAGRRAPALTETGTEKELPLVHATIAIARGAQLFVDGRDHPGGAIELFEGPHHVRVARDGKTVRAVWVGFAEGTALDLGAVTEIASCTNEDFLHVKRHDDGVTATGVRCGAWIAVVPARTPGAIEVASCERDGCTHFMEWRAIHALPEPPLPPPKKRWPGWATWTLAGVGAAAVTTITIVATGALDAQKKEPRFTSGGIKSE